MQKTLGYELALSGRDDGTLECAYLRFKKGKVAKTVEVVTDTLMADYDAGGELIGLEILPVKLATLAKLAPETRRPSFRKFVRGSAPATLVQV